MVVMGKFWVTAIVLQVCLAFRDSLAREKTNGKSTGALFPVSVYLPGIDGKRPPHN
jgi:hypothetical protein